MSNDERERSTDLPGKDENASEEASLEQNKEGDLSETLRNPDPDQRTKPDDPGPPSDMDEEIEKSSARGRDDPAPEALLPEESETTR